MTIPEYHSTWLTGYRPERPTVVCLHGFMGSGGDFAGLPWDERHNYLAVDLVGHGQSPVYVHPDQYRFPQVIAALKQELARKQIARYAVLGYSMGGRVAIGWALADPRVTGLIVESGRPGMATATERQARRTHDQQLAARLLQGDLADFVAAWEKLPLFASQRRLPAPTQARVRQGRLANDRYGLATSLLMMGTGQQPNYWPQLTRLPPTLLVVGEGDAKFTRLAQQMHARVPRLQLRRLPAGHNCHLEQPAAFCAAVATWLAAQRL